MDSIKVFAPATVANVVCGYDILGFAIDEPGDEIILTKNDFNKITITKIEGDGGKLPKNPEKNVVSHVIRLFLEKVNSTQGIDIELYKKMPLNSGMGSSAASSVAALVAINELMGKPFSRQELLPLAMEGERIACGNAHADNVAPALLGGMVLVRSYEPLDAFKLPYPKGLSVVSVHPHVDVPTGEARKIIKERISLKSAVQQWGNIAGLVAGFCTNDLGLVSRSLEDVIIEPVRAMLIPYFYEMKQLALDNGAIGFGISGSGPSVFALCEKKDIAEVISYKIKELLNQKNIESESFVTKINDEGARVIN
ncbi:homoserine kinase [Epilithonimonas lactis]|uniref:Homoserine kinase n=1 Tax=Epilithonimonas lactis TaxID=421072 RepID=A0A085BG50_9FLAO|nr:homoserine kinase [Epilithonimonas lactis]KFC21445.1 serine kinase [Epilithonimonas lactis]SEP85532.1 homoserine kinase [Epilithonimonas lactis]